MLRSKRPASNFAKVLASRAGRLGGLAHGTTTISSQSLHLLGQPWRHNFHSYGCPRPGLVSSQATVGSAVWCGKCRQRSGCLIPQKVETNSTTPPIRGLWSSEVRRLLDCRSYSGGSDAISLGFFGMSNLDFLVRCFLNRRCGLYRLGIRASGCWSCSKGCGAKGSNNQGGDKLVHLRVL